MIVALGFILGFVSSMMLCRLQMRNAVREIDFIKKEYEEGLERIKSLNKESKDIHDYLNEIMTVVDK